MSTNDVRLQNVIAGSLRSQGPAIGYTGSDADIAQQVIPRGMSMGDVSDFINFTADETDALDAESTSVPSPEPTPESTPESAPEPPQV